MKSRQLLPFVAAVAGILCLPEAVAGNIKVIANSRVRADTVSADEIKRIFLEENSSLEDGTHVEPVVEKDGPVHETFLKEYMGRTDDDLQTYYRALVFTGRGSMPKELGSDAEVVSYVARTKGAIGYVSADSNTDGVKTLEIVRGSRGGQRRVITKLEPEYPETLKRLNIGGTVRLRVTISATGKVEDVELLGGNPILGESAISAVKQWVYASGHSRSVADITIPFDSQH